MRRAANLALFSRVLKGVIARAAAWHAHAADMQERKGTGECADFRN
jgi:hypothetical protein